TPAHQYENRRVLWVVAREQLPDQITPDEAGGAGDEAAHACASGKKSLQTTKARAPRSSGLPRSSLRLGALYSEAYRALIVRTAPSKRRHDRSEEHTSELQSRENLVC